MGANNKVRVAICGLHGRGEDHLRNYSQISNVEIAAFCDIDDNVLRQRLAQAEKMGLPKPATYIDIRKLLEDKSIDAVSIATPNHWHTLMAIWACQAGKDVYVEKPCSHNFWEGKQLVKAAQRYNRVVQHGTQIRSASRGSRSDTEAERWRNWRNLHGAWALLQMARHHRPRSGPAGTLGRRLRPLDGTGS